MMHVLPTALDVEAAHERLRDWLIETPVLESELLNQRAGVRVLLKAESLQHTGSFKLRGALNRLLQLKHAERSAGVVAFSSGNHAQGVALAAHWLGMRATIVMPADAPLVKRQSTARWGAQVVPYDREREDREQIATRLAEAQAAALLPPFDHPDVIAGQGTVALELARVALTRHLKLEALYVPCSGGGLVAGAALAIEESVSRVRYLCRRAAGLRRSARVACPRRAPRSARAAADDLRRFACSNDRRDHVCDQSAPPRGGRRGGRRGGFAGNGVRCPAPEARARAFRCRRFGGAAARAAARPQVRRSGIVWGQRGSGSLARRPCCLPGCVANSR